MQIGDWIKAYNHKSFYERHVIIENLDRLNYYFPELFKEFEGLEKLLVILKEEYKKY
jgi:hypothetical protein